MIKKLLATVGIIVVALLTYVGFQTDDFQIARELRINASAEAIFPHINNSKLANDWMPWQESDPDVKMEYSGPIEGVGSISRWSSEGQMGTGEALVVESIANQTVKTQLTYTKPMEMQQLAEITLTPLSTSFGGNHPPLTLVRWQVTGKNNFVGRLFCLVLDMDKHVGGQFEKGLANLKRKMETPSNSPS